MKSSALKKLTAAVASALVLTSAAHAAGLGKLTVLSALGQPLRAEIELTAVSPEEASGLVAKLASPEAFRAANIEFNPALLSLRFNVEQRGGRQFIRVSSSQPLNEPFVDMLLELSWNNGRLVREYTFLLDPAELRATQSAQVAAAAPSGQRAEAPATPAAPADAARPRRNAARPQEAAAEPERERAAGAASKYRVKPGDSLGRIAAQLKPVDVSLDMMLVALYRANPDAFIGNNMNRLKSGRILSVPSTDSIRATGEDEAHGVVVAHAADFNAYRNKLAGQVGASEPVKAPQAGQSAAGKISAKVEERPTAANESQDQLRLSKAAPTTPAGKGTTMSTEDRIAKEKELAEAQARVQELERNVTDLEKVASVKSKAGAEAQQNAAASAAPAAPAAQDKPAPKKLPPIKPAKPAAAAPEPGLLDFIMDNLALVGGGAAALLLGGLLVAQRRKQKPAGKPVAEPSILGVQAEPAHPMFAETGGQSVDTNNSVFNSSFAPSASQLDTNEVDPVAEADVYIAYGRDAQAEEILKEALRTHPERYPVRLKLLEIYAARKDLRAFETQAGEMYSLTRGHGDEWAQAAALGLSIDPLNPLYANGSTPGAATAAPSAEELGQQALLSKELDGAFGAPAAAQAVDTAREPMSFDQHFAGAMGTALPSAAAAPEPVTNAPSQAEDDNVLDFDLGGLAFEPVSNAAPAPLPTPEVTEMKGDMPDLDFDMGAFEPAAPAQAPAVAPVVAETPAEPAKALDEPLDFAFDMDFADPATPAPAAPAATEAAPVAPAEEDPLFGISFDELDTPAPQPAASTAPNSDFDMANLAREFDLPELPETVQAATPPATPEAATPAAALEDPLFDLDTMDFSLEDKPVAAPQPNPVPHVAPALDEPLFDLSDLSSDLPAELHTELHTELPIATPAPAASGFAEPDKIAPQFDGALDVSTLDLDLPADGSLPLPEVQNLSGGEGEGNGGAVSPEHMEMETKLDLAIAYQEIGDKEGARELLEEVIRGGNGEQVNRANALRAALA